LIDMLLSRNVALYRDRMQLLRLDVLIWSFIHMPRSGFGVYCDDAGGCFAGASPADLRGGTGVFGGPPSWSDYLNWRTLASCIPAILQRRPRAMLVAMERHKNIQIKLVSKESLTLVVSRWTLRSSLNVLCI